MGWGSRHSADARDSFARSMRRAATGHLGLALILVIAVGCQGAPPPSTAQSSPSAAVATSSPSTVAAATPRPAPTPVATEPPVAELGPVGGVWRVRKILSLEHRSA